MAFRRLLNSCNYFKNSLTGSSIPTPLHREQLHQCLLLSVRSTFQKLYTMDSFSGNIGPNEEHNQLKQAVPNSVSSETSEPSSVLIPPVRKEMTTLDRNAFDKEVPIPTVLIGGDEKEMFRVFAVLKPYLLKMKNLKPVHVDEEAGCKRVYLNPDLLPVSKFEEFLADVQTKCGKPEMLKSLELKNVRLTYENWSLDDIIDSVLPDEYDKVKGFSKIGHLIHLNLRDHHFAYKNLIAEVLIDKVPNTKTVVNKLNIIDNTFRNFKMELLAGEDNTVVNVKEAKCEFEFDFARVYWNPRLCTEHERIHNLLKKGDTLYDVFAGVGPFAVPVGKKKIRVLANDLNPESFKWLQFNVKKNKVVDFVKTYNQDGREFIRTVIKQDLQEHVSSDKVKNVFHVTMNLPALATDFLDAFWNILEDSSNKVVANSKPKVLVHVYCFVKDATDFEKEAVNLVKEKLGFDLREPEHIQETSFVRNVAPNKEMFRITFYLPHEVMSQKQNSYEKDFVSNICSNPRKRKLSGPNGDL